MGPPGVEGIFIPRDAPGVMGTALSGAPGVVGGIKAPPGVLGTALKGAPGVIGGINGPPGV